MRTDLYEEAMKGSRSTRRADRRAGTFRRPGVRTSRTAKRSTALTSIAKAGRPHYTARAGVQNRRGFRIGGLPSAGVCVGLGRVSSTVRTPRAPLPTPCDRNVSTLIPDPFDSAASSPRHLRFAGTPWEVSEQGLTPWAPSCRNPARLLMGVLRCQQGFDPAIIDLGRFAWLAELGRGFQNQSRASSLRHVPMWPLFHTTLA